MELATRYRIAAIVPCHNEEVAVAKVVADLRAAVPGMAVYVYDNCSTDRTVEQARQAGALVFSEPLKGKGNVVRRAFADIDADIYLLIDGDDTYDAAAAPQMIEKLVSENLDQVVGVRREIEGLESSAYRPAHELGNKALNRIVTGIFGDSMGDMLSGYRVFSRRFVKSFPAVSREFEIETELTVHSLALRIPSASVDVDFRDRAEGSESKLRTYRDGWRILTVILTLTRHERPIYFFGLVAALLSLAAAVLGLPVGVQYLQTGLVPRLPTLFVASFLVVISSMCVMAGLVLDGMRKSRHEVSRLSYMRHPAVRGMYVEDPAPGTILLDGQPPMIVPAPRSA
ncbi:MULTISPECIES: glycosyltransferase family 2 protein [unclassified Nocardioides]|uniref:glycosyltransferase family 2 protein n=1 Tax=unclassified Nocardioides TaxID=2615069 RepID=UPI0009EFE534|nr:MULTISPECIES: glycosyltransferase family 2 protein [unclassified Nocardioides]GAW49884.1 Glycosyl transferase family 2 [Nocardioides sp. PD653-B2]GAW54640.1 Glycosyl transferase family 2 [Nocardioides sp. PD653]